MFIPIGDGRLSGFEGAFTAFVGSLPDARILDDGRQSVKTADFLLSNGEIIADLKCLRKDVLAKMQAVADQIMRERGIEMYGSFPLQDVLDQLPDRDQVKWKVLDIAASRIMKDLEDASQQIKATKARLGLPDAAGAVIVANEGNTVLYPELAAWVLHRLLRRKKRDGSPILNAVEFIWYFGNIPSHALISNNDGVPRQPVLIVQRDDNERAERIGKQFESLLARWSRYINAPLTMAQDFYRGGPLNSMPVRPVGFRAGLPGTPRPVIVQSWGYLGKLPSECPHCEAPLTSRPDRRLPSSRTEEPQPDLFLLWFECPDSGVPWISASLTDALTHS